MGGQGKGKRKVSDIKLTGVIIIKRTPEKVRTKCDCGAAQSAVCCESLAIAPDFSKWPPC